MDACPVLHINNRLIMGGGPYEGMEIPDYKDLIKVYKQSLADRDKAKLIKLQEQAKKNGQVIPQRVPIRLGVRPDASSLPAWPAGVRDFNRNPESGVELEPVKKPMKRMDVQISNT
jgi:hypothetical protein